MIIWLMWSHENAALAAAHRIDPDGVPTSFVAGDEVYGNDPKLRTAAAAAEFGGRGITVADSFDGFLYASHGRQPKTGRHDRCRVSAGASLRSGASTPRRRHHTHHRSFVGQLRL